MFVSVTYLASGRMTHEDDFLLADRSQVLDKARDVGNVVCKRDSAEALESTSQAQFKERVSQHVGVLEMLCNYSGIWHCMGAISKTPNEDEGILAVCLADLVGDRAWRIRVHSDWEGGAERHFCNV